MSAAFLSARKQKNSSYPVCVHTSDSVQYRGTKVAEWKRIAIAVLNIIFIATRNSLNKIDAQIVLQMSVETWN